jgi:hypothetical protein
MDKLTLEALHAQLTAFHSLVIALHEEGVLPIQAVVNRLGARLESDQTQFHEPENKVARQIYEGLLSFEEVLSPFAAAPRGTAPPRDSGQ